MSRNRIEQHPDEYREDLNPHYAEGQNDGPTWQRTRTAYDIKEIHQRLSDLRNDELKQIPILDEGSRLEQGAVYFNLRYPERGEVRARGDMVAGPQDWYVAKSSVDYQTWNLLIGIDNWDRLGDLVDEAADGSDREPTVAA
jgi:hypothetical protein